MTQTTAPGFQEAIEAVEALSPDDQTLLIDLIRHRLAGQRRAEIVAEVGEARAAYGRNDVQRGTVADLMGELTP